MNHEGHKVHEALDARVNVWAREIVAAGLKVHKTLGPGLLESAYEHCLAYELQTRGLKLQRQSVLLIVYEATQLDAGYRLDLIVENAIIIEIKAVDVLAPIHEAQLLTYLKLSGHRLGFLVNFNVVLFKQGIKRMIL